MDLVTVTGGVLFGNIITAMFLYSLVRIRRNERDALGIWLGIFSATATLVIGLALR